MYKKLICLACFVLVLGFVSNASAELVGHWRFDEGSGTTAQDQSGNGNDGTLINDPVWAIGIINGALQFDGIDDYVNCGNDLSLNVTDAVTIAAWVKLNSVPPAFSVLIAGKYSAYWLEWRDTEVLSLSMFINGAYNGSGLTLNLADGDWHHIALTYDGTQKKGYHNRQEVFSEGVSGAIDVSGSNFLVGEGHPASASYNGCPDGLIDDVRVYNRALTQEEIQLMMRGKGYPLALGPDPADGAMLTDIWVNLGWRAGDFAVSHDVYIGDNFDDVNDGTADTFRGNKPLTSTTFFVGFFGYPYPDGLVPGTTYYWRIDEVNDTDPNSPWKGDVWSFWIQPRIAYNPTPADGAKFIDPNADLSWTAGLDARVHYVYFGDNFDDVNNATEGSDQGATTYALDTLETDKTYYWRVDESDDGITMLKGDVWSFKTLPDIPITDPNLVGWWTLDEGMGTTAVDWSGHGNHGTFVGDPQWVAGYDGDALEFDGSGDFLDCGTDASLEISGAVSITAWIKVGAQGIAHKVVGNQDGSNGGYKMSMYNDNRIEFEIRTSDNTYILNRDIAGGTEIVADVWYHVAGIYSQGDGYIRTYVDGNLDRELFTTEELGASPGILYIGCEPYNTSAGNFDGVMDDVRLYNKALTQDEINETMRGDPLLAGVPNPANRSTPYIREATPLNWSPGENASQHDVYFGIDKDTVADANASDTTGVYRGRQFGTSYTPPDVEWGGGPYYWRIDEYNTDATISEGKIWSFTVTDFIGIEDFEDYNDFEPDRIFDVWSDGWGVDTNGSEVGYADPNFPDEHHVETTIVHGGSQSMPYFYENNFKYSEATYSPTQRDWTEEGVGVLSLWFYGDTSNAAERMYVALNGGTAVYNDNDNASQIEEWTEWTIDLQAFTGVGLTNVNRIAIGFGDKNNLQAGGTGMVFFDDIRLYRPAPDPETP